MRSLVIGFGARGERHLRVLASIGHETAVVSLRRPNHPHHYGDVGQALGDFRPDYVVVSNETAGHRPALFALRRSVFEGPILVEKPLFESARPGDPSDLSRVYVGYNLRFDPLLQQLRSWVQHRRLVASAIYVGRHLWAGRGARDPQSMNSATRASGGGVLRDLSHELDYAQLLFGAWRRVAAIGGMSGALGADVDDRWSILLECAYCPQVSIGMS